jgi:outer membrane usher protein
MLNTNSAQLQADVNAGRGNNGARLSANGSVGWLDSVPFASRRIDDGAFAIVRVGGAEGVAVSRSNQVAAVTNADGVAVVTGLLPYQANQITVKAEDLPLDVQVQGVKEVVMPYARSGVVVEMPVRRARNFLVALHLADGTPVPAGSTVILDGGPQFVVAKRGEVYLTDVPGRSALLVRSSGSVCTVPLEVKPTVPSESHLGPLTCRGAS